MNRPLSVLLIEDDPGECSQFNHAADDLEDVCLVAATNNAKAALEHTTDYLPDAIILDLELHKGGGDGISFLRTLNSAGLPYTPYILVTTNNINPVTHEQVRRLGAGFIIVKSQEGYSAEYVIEFLRNIKQSIQSSRNKEPAAEALEPPTNRKKRLAAQASAEIDLIGISPKVIGRRYLIDSILLLIENQEQNPIAAVAQKYGKTDASVERAMQNAIDKAWRSNDIEDLQKVYTARISSDKGVPTLTEFIFFYVNKMQLK